MVIDRIVDGIFEAGFINQGQIRATNAFRLKAFVRLRRSRLLYDAGHNRPNRMNEVFSLN